MTSWKPQTIGHEEVIRGLIHSTRPSIIDLSCSTKGSEVGMTSIFQKEQELHALQKALNLPQTASYSTTLHQLKPAQLNSTFIPPYSQHARAVAETKLDTESDMSRTLDLSHLGTSRNKNTDSVMYGKPYSLNGPRNFDQLSTVSGMHGNFQQPNEFKNFDHMKTETTVNGAHGLVQGQRNACITKPFDGEIYNTSNIPIKINQEFDKSECRWTESSHFLPKQEMQHSETLKLHQNHLTNALQSGSNGYSYVMRTPRYHFDDTEILLEKIKEAYKIIEHQKHALAKSENEIIALHRHQEMLELNQEVSLQEITTLKLENQNMDKMKSENTKKREALLERINKLDQDFKELSVSHNALLIECKKREGDFLQSDLKLNALEAYNNNLQQDNTRMLKECEMAKQQVSEIMAENRRMQMEVQKARGETALALQDKQSIAIENTSLQSASSEMNKQLVTVKSSKDKLRQEFEKLHMEYNVKCNRVSLLEEEVKQQQETLEVLQQELEQSFQREARKSAMENHLLNVVGM
ncbi:uncharacterized protein LOC114574840 isoform X2 [Exaiptasia diaphana]|uniref:Uncharacterized protein n=1 Tax=Exaiptasia diaphana TaxID=2652724 RepID=A0A913YGX2_EXADI|nr:uncharacterized protein LOC114574840 isoform X2 [Exaiptasia diaphana]